MPQINEACKKCEKEIDAMQGVEVEGETFCKECFENMSVDSCFSCRDNILLRNMSDAQGERYCDYCFNQLPRCENCDEPLQQEYTNGLCETCYSEREEENGTREVDLSCKAYQSTTQGEVINSSRTFGIEIEVQQGEGHIRKIAEFLARAYGIEHDGSIDGSGVEIQTPILRGEKGEKEMKRVYKKLRDMSFRTDNSCGAHVHLGAEDFVGNFERTRMLFLVYTTFSDAILAMIPKHRREGNNYCRKLSNNYSPDDIMRAQNMEELERLWYKDMNDSHIEARKGERYDDSRYYGINFHSLLGKNKTLEIRYHEGTLRASHILRWVAMHQLILDRVMGGRYSQSTINEGKRAFLLQDKVRSFIEFLSPPDYLHEYIKERVGVNSYITL